MNTLLILQSHTKVAACDTELYYKRARQMFSNVPRGVIRKKKSYIYSRIGFVVLGFPSPPTPTKTLRAKSTKEKRSQDL